MQHLTYTNKSAGDRCFGSIVDDYGGSSSYFYKWNDALSADNSVGSLLAAAGDATPSDTHVFDEDVMLGALDAEIYNPIDTIQMMDERPDGRLSLAYERLTHIPRPYADTFAATTHTLDLSHNQLKDLSILANFRQLTTLILDQNTGLLEHTLPALPALRILWLNNCAIRQVGAWLRRLQVAAPQLRQLSLFGNPGCRSQFNGGTAAEERAYRQFVVAALPQLEHLDDAVVTDECRALATAAGGGSGRPGTGMRMGDERLVVVGDGRQQFVEQFGSTLDRFLVMQQQRRASQQQQRERVSSMSSAKRRSSPQKKQQQLQQKSAVLKAREPVSSTPTTTSESS